ncbi:MAG: hypothetical protein QM535_09205 [Limnohabitans sp.]|nr:hypothetical protein [Limnohabitans sp.]
MKHPFTNKYFYWLLIILSLLSSIGSILKLLDKIDFLSNYFVKIIFALICVLSFLKLILKDLNAERYARYFIVITLITPTFILVNQFITYSLFYEINRFFLLNNAVQLINCFIGGILLFFSIKFSAKDKIYLKKDIGYFIIFIGITQIIYTSIKVIESNYNTELNSNSLWKIVLKTLISLLILFIGSKLIKEKINLTKAIVFTLLSILIFGAF